MYTNRIIDSTYQKNGKKCLMTEAKEPIFVFSPVCMALQKNGPFSNAFNEQLKTSVIFFYCIFVIFYSFIVKLGCRLQAQIEAGLMGFYYAKATVGFVIIYLFYKEIIFYTVKLKLFLS